MPINDSAPVAVSAEFGPQYEYLKIKEGTPVRIAFLEGKPCDTYYQDPKDKRAPRLRGEIGERSGHPIHEVFVIAALVNGEYVARRLDVKGYLAGAFNRSGKIAPGRLIDISRKGNGRDSRYEITLPPTSIGERKRLDALYDSLQSMDDQDDDDDDQGATH